MEPRYKRKIHQCRSMITQIPSRLPFPLGPCLLSSEHPDCVFFVSLQTDAHYSLLSLLLFLSDSPSNTDFTERPRIKEAGELICLLFPIVQTLSLCQSSPLHLVSAEEEDNFDWARYLMEGEDIDTGPYPDTPVSKS